MRQIEKIDLNIGQAYLSEWSESMAIRELIANAIDETNDGKIEIKIFNNIISNVILVKENIYLYRQKEKEIIVPVKALEYMKECSI